MNENKDYYRGSTLKRLRKDRKLTQQQLADYLGLSKQAISKFENGVPYSLDTAIAIAKFFNVDIEFLMENTRAGTLAKPIMEDMLQKKEIVDSVLFYINPKIEQLEKRMEKLENELTISKKN